MNKPTRIPLPFRRPSLPPLTRARKQKAIIEILSRSDLSLRQKGNAIEMLRQLETED
jgi:hypothetical protein